MFSSKSERAYTTRPQKRCRLQMDPLQSPEALAVALLEARGSHDAAARFLQETVLALNRQPQALAPPQTPTRPDTAPSSAANWRRKAEPASSWWDKRPSTADEERLQKIEAIFASVDADGSKVITRGEFVGALTTAPGESIWGVFTAAAADALFDEIDVSKTGKITKAKFGHFVDVKTIESLQAQFKSADSDRDRQLTLQEFRGYGRRLGITRQRTDALWAKIDENGNGKINFVEFRNWARDRLAPATVDALFRADPDE